MPGLGTSFGRGGATTAPADLVHSDCILIQGSSMAEAHPVAFRWVVAARERGAFVIHVDPRYSRTSALADLWVPLRAGTDVVFLGALVRWVLQHEKYFREYVVHYTNAATILRDDFRDTEELNGLFSGYDPKARRYDDASWQVAGGDEATPERDPTLSHPRCVFQVLKRHFERYTPEMVEKVCGVPKASFEQVAERLTAASGPARTAAICYAVGWTQHSKGVQIIRTAAILQLLLGNVGRPGGGIMALRGHASIQGSTDIPTLYDLLPGYLPMPRADRHQAFAPYLEEIRGRGGHWTRGDAYAVSLLKALYGQRATPENDFGFAWLPKLTGDHSHFSFFMDMADGGVDGLFVMGQNPAVGAQHSRLERKALARLKWLVVRDLVEIETASFWYASPEIARGELSTEQIETEVFLFPAASYAEKSGTFTNTQRLLQFREQAVPPPGDARSELWFVHQLALRLRQRALASDDPTDEPLRALDWWYPTNAHGEPDPEAVLAEINGWHVAGSSDAHHGAQVASFSELCADGSTASGCWIYAGVLGPDGVNRAASRAAEGRYGHGWGFAWPADRRILYNRASAAPDGTPWSDEKKLVWWDTDARRWTGDDVPDVPADLPPKDAAPFIMLPGGRGRLFVPSGLSDGPLPSHYEPLETPVPNLVYAQQQSPVAQRHARPDNPLAAPEDPRFPYVLTTYRLTEHHTAGGMSRFLSHLAELMPELFIEMSPELAREVGAVSGQFVMVGTPRGLIEARALVTRRLRPLRVAGRVVHQVAMPFHWGSAGPVRGDVTNDLIPLSGEPNVGIHESKALCCAIRPGRRPPDHEIGRWLEELSRMGVGSDRAVVREGGA